MILISNARKKIEKFPIYRRSPRAIMEPASDKIEISKPGNKSNISKTSLVQIIVTPLSSLAVTVLVGVLMKRGLLMLMGVVATGVSTILSLTKYFSDRKTCKETNAKREELYGKYLLDKRKEIYAKFIEEEKCYKYNSPKLEVIEKLTNDLDSRIYEKSMYDSDFLEITIGYNDSPFGCEVSYDCKELEVEKDDLEFEAKDIAEEFTTVKDKPLNIDLKTTNLGLIGNKDVVHEQLHILISKLCFFRSYLDMQIVLFINAKYYNEFRYVQWYPHFMLESIGTSGLVHDGDVANQMLMSMHKILTSRSLEFEDKKKKKISFSPHYIFIIDDDSLIRDHAIMEHLSKNETYGFSIVYTSTLQDNLPENVQTIVKYKNNTEGTLVINNRILTNKDFTLDRVDEVNVEWLARNLSVLQHEQGRVTHLPENISFFDMYKVKKPSELNIPLLWASNKTNKSLAVPLGIRSTGELMMLNLHEKAHGPHGLVAGTTGSGKSEIIQSYILSLAVNFHPYDVGFLLIDYKGGGMANLFKNLPHLLGTITNLDASDSMRALASIKSELARRQQLFADNDVNHINDYAKLFKEGKASEPLPHLFWISDEFAELKQEQPDFMKELVSTARVGRSLGIHLILATQKPAGVVTDQIWSNSRFKLALKVQDENDSKGIIKTPDAAYIKNPGRAYLQVGNNEIYELFQSAYSGALCSEDEEEVIDNRVYIRNHLGQMELINDDLDTNEKNTSKISQLDSTINYIAELYENMKKSINLKEVSRPWLPPLPDMFISPFVETKLKNIKEDKTSDIYSDVVVADLSAELGMIDFPKKQAQEIFNYDFRVQGNLMLIGATGYGKSTLLKTILFSLALKNPASLFHFYVMDLGNGSLLPFKNLPQCADYINYDDSEKLARFTQIMLDEIKSRKKKFAEASAMNIDMYNRSVDEKLPLIVFAIDNYDVVKELDNDFETFFGQLSREGNNIGIYCMITAGRSSAVRYNIINNFKTKISLFMFDPADVRSFVGKCEWGIKDIKGRAYISVDEVSEMQVFSTHSMEDEDKYIDMLKEDIKLINESYHGIRPKRIPVMPSDLSMDVFEAFVNDNSNNYSLDKNCGIRIPIGINTEDISLSYIDIANTIQLVIGGPLSGKTNLFKIMLKQIPDTLQTFVVDDKSLELKKFSNRGNINHVSTKDEYMNFFKALTEVVNNRHKEYQTAKQSDSSLIPKEYYSKLDNILILIADIEAFTFNLGLLNSSDIWNLMLELQNVNITVIAAANAASFRGVDEFTKAMKQTLYGVITGKASDQMNFTVPRGMTANERTGIGYVIEKGRPSQILIPYIN